MVRIDTGRSSTLTTYPAAASAASSLEVLSSTGSASLTTAWPSMAMMGPGAPSQHSAPWKASLCTVIAPAGHHLRCGSTRFNVSLLAVKFNYYTVLTATLRRGLHCWAGESRAIVE